MSTLQNMPEAQPREYKDGFIRKLFNNPAKALQLYGAISGKTFDMDVKIEMKTLENVFLSKLRNDLAFIVDGVLIVIIEHQSTLNRNIPLRALQYILLFFQIFFELGQALYHNKLIKLPKPEFYMLYNGRESYPAEGIMRLSDAFIGLEADEAPGLELIVKVININYSAHSEVLEKNDDIKGYAIFVDKVNKIIANGFDLKSAVRKAMLECLEDGILVDFLTSHRKEIENMFSLVYDEEIARQVAVQEAKEEAWEEAWGKAWEKGQVELIERMLIKGRSPESIAADTDIPLEKVNSIKNRQK